MWFFSSITISQAQIPVNSVTYGTKYHVKPGDTASYRYSKIYQNGLDYISLSLLALNGSYIPVNITQGSTINIKIFNVSDQFNSYQYVLENVTFIIPGRSAIETAFPYPIFLSPAFDNSTMVESFINSTLQYNNFNYTYDTNNIYYHQDYNNSIYDANNHPLFITTSYTSTINWHTGWVQHSETKSIFENNTIYTDVIIDKVGSGLSSGSIALIVIGLPVAAVGLIGLVWYDYKKHRGSSSKRNGNSPQEEKFSTYFKSKMTSKNQSKKVDKTHFNSSLDKLEQIIDENK